MERKNGVKSTTKKAKKTKRGQLKKIKTKIKTNKRRSPPSKYTELTNNDIHLMLSIPQINIPLEKRLLALNSYK